jgi:hypothetical protein
MSEPIVVDCPPGCAIVERVGWDDDGRFTATLVFPNGPPSLPLACVWESTPMQLVKAEPADDQMAVAAFPDLAGAAEVAEAEPHG